MCFNRFCIEEDAAFELFDVHNLKKRFQYIEDKSKGKGYKRVTINDIAEKNLKLHKKSNLMSTSLILLSKKLLKTPGAQNFI